MNLTDDETAVILGALADAAEYRAQLAASAGCTCTDTGGRCDECAPDWDRADEYQHLHDALADAGPPPRPEDTIRTRGGRL